MLDDQERGPELRVQLADLLDHSLDQRRIDAAGRLVEHDQLRLEHEDLRELDELLLPEGQCAGANVRVLRHTDELEQLQRALVLVTCNRVRGQLPPREGAQRRDNVLEHGHLAEQARDLEGAAEAEMRALERRQPVDALPVEADTPAVGAHHPGDQVERGGLAGAVRPDQRGDRALLHVEGEIVDRSEPAEALRKPLDLEQHARLGGHRLARARRQARGA